MNMHLRLSGGTHQALRQHLLQDENESAALLLCGRRNRDDGAVLIGHKSFPVPLEACEIRTPDYLHWRTEAMEGVFEEAAKNDWSVVKIHSHPGGYSEFSNTDDASDRALFPSLYGWADVPHASAVMLPDGSMFGRHVDHRGCFTPLSRIMVAGDDIQVWDALSQLDAVPQTANRHARAFGAATTMLLKRLSVGVVGCSGTGSIVIEQLARLQLGRLTLVDPERAEDVNANRIVGLTAEDVTERRLKVEVMERCVLAMELGTEVIALPIDLMTPQAVKAIAACDLVIGCMDGASGRHILNKLCSTYCVPYIDVGVRLVADGEGGISHVCGSVHYLQPGGSSLLSRELYTMQEVEAELLMKSDPKAYAERLKEKYIKGVQETRPAVVSVNTIYAGLAVTEMLARLHPFRDDPNRQFAQTCLSLNHGIIDTSAESAPCKIINRYEGRGDMPHLLGIQALEDRAS